MGDESQVRILLEEVLNSGKTPEEVCASHPELLEEVRTRWLRIRDLAGDLERAFPSSGPGWPRRPEGVARDPGTLPRIPGYELEASVGHGGMGAVYKATHVRLGRMVAVKMLLGGAYAPAKELDGLLREARTVAGLGHPNIVEVFDAGEVDGLPYFTMEFVGGGSLSDKLKGVPMPPREAAALVETLSAAVQAAHDKGVVHRDLKPGNVLLTPDGTPKIADFGLARRMGGDVHATTGGARFGTPSYMAPEQALGVSEAFDSSVDVYALGAILYETLTGRPPFRADSPVETQRQVISEEPVPPSRVNQRVPRDLETICLKCLQKRPSSRYPSAGELREDLRRYLAGEPISARNTPAVVRALKWARRHPTATTVLAFVTLVAVAAIVAVASCLATAAASRRVVEGDLDEVERAQRDSDWATAKSALDRASLRMGTSAPNDLRLRLDAAERNADIVKKLEAIRMTRALGSGSNESIEQSDRDYMASYRAAGVRTDDPPDEAARHVRSSNISTALISGMYHWLVCRNDRGRTIWLLSVLRIVDSDHGGWRDRSRDSAVWKDRDAARRLVVEARVPGQSIDYLLWFAELLREFGNDPTPLLRQIQSAHSNDFWANDLLAAVLRDQGQDAEALRFFQAAAALRPEAALVHNNLGHCLRNLNRFDESIDEQQEAVRLDPTKPWFHGNLGISLQAVGRYTEAKEQFELGLGLRPSDPMFHANLGIVLAALDRDSEAIEHFKEAAALGPGSVPARHALITALIRARRGPEAVTMFRSWIEKGGDRYEEWDGLAELCLFVGARDDYENTRKTLLESFGSSSDPVVCEKLGRACLLAPIPEDQRLVAGAAIDRALESEREQTTWRYPYFKLEKALAAYRAGRADETLSLIDTDVSRVLRPMPQLIMAMALSDLHRNAEALAQLGRAAAMFDWRPGAANNREAWVFHVLRREAESKILANLDAFTRGGYWPSTADERLALIATSEGRGMHLASARLFAEALASDPALAGDIESQCRYRAACAAAVCGSGRASEGPRITSDEQARWRAQSLQWLRADLAALRELATKAKRSGLMAKWRADADLRGVRDPQFLATLPEGERSAFTALWAEVNAVLASREAN